MRSMQDQYGKEKGESVFYASENKGNIQGVKEDTDDRKALEAAEEESKKKPKKKKKSDSSDPVEKAMGKPKKSLGIEHFRKKHKASGQAAVKRHNDALEQEETDERLTQDSIEYKKMGILIADSLGYRVDEVAPLIIKAGVHLIKKKAIDMAKEKAMEMANKKAAEMAAGKKEEPQLAHTEFKNSYLRSLMEVRYGGRYGSSPHGGRPPEGWTPPTPLPKKKKKKEAPKEEPPKKELQKEGNIMNNYIKTLIEAAGRKLSPLTKPFEKISASEVASEKAKTQARLPGVKINPSAGHLIQQKRARQKGKKPEGRGHGTPNPIQPSRT